MRCKPSISLGRRIWIIGFLLPFHRDTGNHSAVWYPGVGWCYCVPFTHPEEYMMTMINAFLSTTPFREQAHIFWCCKRPGVIVLHWQPCSMLQEIVCVSGYRSQWHNEIYSFLSAKGAAYTVCVWCAWIPLIIYIYFMHVCGFYNRNHFSITLYRCVVAHVFIAWNWAQMPLMHCLQSAINHTVQEVWKRDSCKGQEELRWMLFVRCKQTMVLSRATSASGHSNPPLLLIFVLHRYTLGSSQYHQSYRQSSSPTYGLIFSRCVRRLNRAGGGWIVAPVYMIQVKLSPSTSASSHGCLLLWLAFTLSLCAQESRVIQRDRVMVGNLRLLLQQPGSGQPTITIAEVFIFIVLSK